MPDVEEEGDNRPTLLEATEYFRIARESTIHTWWKNRDKIFGKRSVFSAYPPKWPALEKTLVEHFIAARRENKIVTVHWFRRIAQKIWQSLYPKLADVFIFSNGWFWRFLRRHCIVRRRITKVATKPPVSQFQNAVWGSGMMFVELRRTRILSEGNSQFVLNLKSDT
jgi:hypothetical protein